VQNEQAQVRPMANLKQVWSGVAGVVVVLIAATAAYPLISVDGLFDRWFGPWWGLIVPLGLAAAFAINAYRKRRNAG